MKNQDTTVIFVNPVQRKSAQGRHMRQYMILNPATGEVTPSNRGSMNQSSEDSVPHSYSFPTNPVTNRLETGLDVMIKNPFKDSDPSYIMSTYSLSGEWTPILEGLVKQDRITKQVYYEILAQVQPGFYTSELSGGSIFQKGWNSAKMDGQKNFLESFKIYLYPRPNRFSTDSARSRLAIELIKIHNKIANSADLVNTATHNWFISEENEAEMRVNEKRDKIAAANYHYYNFRHKETPFKRYQLAILLKDVHGNSIAKGELSDEKVVQTLNGFIADGPSQMQNIDFFLDTCTLLETPQGREKFEMQYLIQMAFNTNIMSPIDGYVVWHSKKDKPNVSKFTDEAKLISFMVSEYAKDDGDDVVNWYNELIKELKNKGAWIDD